MRYRPSGAAAVIVTLALGAAVASCKSDPSGTISLTTGDEVDAFSRSPAPTTLIVENIGLDGNATEVARVPLPSDDFSLGDRKLTDAGSFRVRAEDATGKVLLKGESLFVQFGALENAGLQIFLQRTGELARLPQAPAALDAPRVGVTVARYLFAASGTSSFLYDLLLLKTAPAFPALPRPAKSVATFGTAAIIIDELGATTLDLSSASASDLAAPPGGTFAEIAGGGSTVAADGSIYVVGGTRSAGGASTRIFAISPVGGTGFAALAVPREGACAAWVEGRGLFVYGGGGAEAAGELLAPGSQLGTKLPLPADPVKGCGATTLDGSHVLVVGGAGGTADVSGPAPARVIDLACTASCVPTPWKGTLPLVRAEAFPLAADAALIAGDDASGASHVFRATPAGVVEIALKVPRRGARLVPLPIAGTVGIVGGAPAIEHYVD